jgi:hypothetical protein
MAPTPWTTFTFFGIPFALGVLGGVHGTRLCWRVYRRYTVERAAPEDTYHGRPAAGETERSPREQVGRAVGLLLVSAFLLAHSGRWLLSIYGYL